MDLDVIENGMPPERPRQRLILSRIAIAAVIVAGVAFAVSRHHAATAENVRPPASTTTTATPRRTQPVQIPGSAVDSRPIGELPEGLLTKAQQRLAAPAEAPRASVELRGSNFQGGVDGVGLHDESVTAAGTIRVDVICLGTGLVSMAVQDGTPDGRFDVGEGTELNCAVGKVVTTSLATAGRGFFVYAQLTPDTVAILAYAIRLT